MSSSRQRGRRRRRSPSPKPSSSSPHQQGRRPRRRRSPTPSSLSSSSSSSSSSHDDANIQLLEEPVAPPGEQDYQHRRRYTEEEIQILEQSYTRNPRPPKREKQRLANLFHILPRQIQIWFQNRRAKESKIKREQRQHHPEDDNNDDGNNDVAQGVPFPNESRGESSRPQQRIRSSGRSPEEILGHEPQQQPEHNRRM